MKKTIVTSMWGVLTGAVVLAMVGGAFAQKPGKIQPLDQIAAIVNDSVITETEVNSQLELLSQQLAERNMKRPSIAVMKKQVLQHLIDVDIQLQLAKRHGLTVDSDEVDNAIQRIAKKNRIDVSHLRQEVVKQGLSWAKYRENVQKEMLMSQLQQKALGGDIKITEKQVDDFLKTNTKSNQKNFEYHVKNINLPLPEAPSPEQLQQAKTKAKALIKKLHQGADFSQLAIAQSSGQFALEGGDLGYRRLMALPEIFAKQVVKMKPGEVAGPLRAPNGLQIIKLVAVKGTQSKHWITLTHARHILLKADAVTTPTEVKRKIASIRRQIAQGKSFAQMAKTYSADKSNSIKGGDLGWVHPGELVPAFEKVMDKLKPGVVSQPVQTKFGWHLIQVEARKRIDDTKAYERQQARQAIFQRKFNREVQNWLRKLRAQAYIKEMKLA